MFNALRHRNFRLFLGGQFVSLIGTWMQQLATSWLVYKMTASPLWLGISMFSSQIPMFLFGLFAGVIVDQVNRHRLLMLTQSLAAIQALVLAFLTLWGKLTLSELIALNLTLGVINAFDMPGRQSFYVQMIGDRSDLSNAIALNSSVMNGTRLIGPAIAGATIAAFGEGICFLLNAVSYLAVLFALAIMKFEIKTEPARRSLALLDNLRIGLEAAFRNPAIRAMLLILSYMSVFGMSLATLFPALAAQIRGGGPGILGTITVASGIGSLIGALYLANRREMKTIGRDIGICAIAFPLGLMLLAVLSHFSREVGLHPICACLTITTLAMMLIMAGGNTVIQSLVDDDKRGRVMSFFTFSLLGIAPFGNLLIGAMAQRWGMPITLFTQGCLALVGALVFYPWSKVIQHSVNQRRIAASH